MTVAKSQPTSSPDSDPSAGVDSGLALESKFGSESDRESNQESEQEFEREFDPGFFPVPPSNLPYEDGEPLETPRHRSAMNLLIRSLAHYWSQRIDYFVGGNMFLYYSSAQVKNREFRGPDFFVCLDVERDRDRKYWAIWDEGGKYPDVIIELMSESTATVDQGEKKHLYERTFKTADYYVYDPYDGRSLQGWHLGEGQRYQEIQPDAQGRLWCQSLNLWLGNWEGTIDDATTQWLRFYDADQQLVLLPEEAAVLKAEAAEQKAEAAEQKAEAAVQEAEVAAQKAEEAERKAQQAEQLAQQERLRAERLAEQLRSLGISLED
ncbi:MAG: Uma2 family endonuclease [Oculatellaceae cyanobacterium Prado106]|jgi:Uma2 family endonuclease|nr:Uma2 family endonuclease [Oculatellaceae cyanobacterium Prado106]